MQAYVIHDWGSTDNLHLETVERPTPAADEVVVRVKAIDLNPIDYIILGGGLKGILPLPATIGCDVSGKVEEVGDNVATFNIGDEVMGLINFPGTDGTIMGRGYAEFVAVPASQLVIKPKKLPFIAAAALPAAGLTAYQALHDVADVQAGQAILIHGAAGGVGHLAVQLARRLGADVTVTARENQRDFVGQLGAQEIIDFTQQEFEKKVKNIDIVFDTVGRDVMRRSLAVLKPGGTLVTTQWPEIDTVQDEAKVKNIYAKAVTVHPNGEQLADLADFAASGSLEVHIDKVYSFKELPVALKRLKNGGVRGKLVIETDHL